jgi:organic radical activating enzyme
MKNLEVNKIFYSLQGEGTLLGHPAVFVRLSGCNLSCTFCDTKHAYGDTMTVDMIISSIVAQKAKTRLVVLTGGEPFIQPVGPLIAALKRQGYAVAVETNGTVYPPDCPPELLEDVLITCSPKKADVDLRLAEFIDVYKILVSAQFEHKDEKRAKLFALTGRAICIQPLVELGCRVDNLAAAINICKRNDFMLSPQLHKMIGVD